MRIELDDAALGHEVPALRVTVAPGAPVVIAVETDERPKLVSLLIGGRARTTAGAVRVDGIEDAAELRRRVALVDTPFASEPNPTVALRTAVAEELAFAGLPSGRRAVLGLLERHGLSDVAARSIVLLHTADRIRLLAELAVLRPGVDALVVTSPERHGGDPSAWFPALAEIAARGIAVAIVTDLATADILIPLGAVRDAALPDLPDLDIP